MSEAFYQPVEYKSLAEADRDLAIEMSDLADDPLEWVYFAFPWGDGQLADFNGPDDWQADFLRTWGEEIRLRGFDGRMPVLPYRTSTTSGHGVGKSALVAWIVWFIMSTRPLAKGRVTANSIPQLLTTTWPEITKWGDMCLTRRWFNVTSGSGAMKIQHSIHKEKWSCTGLAWDATRPAAFAGQHAVTSTSFYVFDEASEIAKIIMETAQGGLTDGEPMMFLFGNPTQPTGYFYETHHGQLAKRFRKFHVDSRKAKMTNKELIKQWIEDYGIDSDFVKVRVLGEFPVAGNRQFIPSNIVTRAMSSEREPFATIHDPVCVGVDVARYGDDESTIYVRRGRDARTFEPRIFRGVDNVQLAFEVRRIAEKLLPDAINIDSGGGAGVIDLLRAWGVPNVNEINFGATSPDEEYDGFDTYMMGQLRTWLKQDKVTIPDDFVLKRQLTSRQYWMKQGKRITAVKIESKDELKKAQIAGKLDKESPDRADGLALTFAVPVPMRREEDTRRELAGMRPDDVIGVEYDRFKAAS